MRSMVEGAAGSADLRVNAGKRRRLLIRLNGSCYPPPFTLAQVSRRPTVRLNTGRPGRESGSRQK